MKASTKLKREIMHYASTYEDYEIFADVLENTETVILNRWNNFLQIDSGVISPLQICYEYAQTVGEKSNIEPESYDRHYDSESRYVECVDGSFVGFLYWTGGGKHGNPMNIPFIEEAYDLKLEREYTVTKLEFSKVNE